MNKLSRNENVDRAARDTSSLVRYFGTTLWLVAIPMADQNNWNRSTDVRLAANSIRSSQCSAEDMERERTVYIHWHMENCTMIYR